MIFKTHLRLQPMRAFYTAKPHSLHGCVEPRVPFGCAELRGKAMRPNAFVMSRSAFIALISQGGWHLQGFARRNWSAQGSTQSLSGCIATTLAKSLKAFGERWLLGEKTPNISGASPAQGRSCHISLQLCLHLLTPADLCMLGRGDQSPFMVS